MDTTNTSFSGVSLTSDNMKGFQKNHFGMEQGQEPIAVQIRQRKRSLMNTSLLRKPLSSTTRKALTKNLQSEIPKKPAGVTVSENLKRITHRKAQKRHPRTVFV
jgi:hypothetical protein